MRKICVVLQSRLYDQCPYVLQIAETTYHFQFPNLFLDFTCDYASPIFIPSNICIYGQVSHNLSISVFVLFRTLTTFYSGAATYSGYRRFTGFSCSTHAHDYSSSCGNGRNYDRILSRFNFSFLCHLVSKFSTAMYPW